MVAISVSYPGLVYKILTKSKRTTIRPSSKRWEYASKRLDADEEVLLQFYHKQQSRYGFRFLETSLTEIENFDLSEMTEDDALLDGCRSINELHYLLRQEYGEDCLNDDWLRIWWNPDFEEEITSPNKTTIDWFKKLNQKLYTINPLVIVRKLNNEQKQAGECRNCYFDCLYCYGKKMYSKFPKAFNPGFYESRLRGLKRAWDNVFISSMTDLFHKEIPDDFLQYVIEKTVLYNQNHCNLYYLTKNPERYLTLKDFFNKETDFLGTTIETDSYNFQEIENISKAPTPEERLEKFAELEYENKYISLEPIMKFSKDFVKRICDCKVRLVIMGANTDVDTVGLLKEPLRREIIKLYKALRKNNISIIRKGNLERLTAFDTLDSFFNKEG